MKFFFPKFFLLFFLLVALPQCTTTPTASLEGSDLPPNHEIQVKYQGPVTLILATATENKTIELSPDKNPEISFEIYERKNKDDLPAPSSPTCMFVLPNWEDNMIMFSPGVDEQVYNPDTDTQIYNSPNASLNYKGFVGPSWIKYGDGTIEELKWEPGMFSNITGNLSSVTVVRDNNPTEYPLSQLKQEIIAGTAKRYKTMICGTESIKFKIISQGEGGPKVATGPVPSGGTPPAQTAEKIGGGGGCLQLGPPSNNSSPAWAWLVVFTTTGWTIRRRVKPSSH